jgi:imidazolonepropionase-like amidohydrolase
VAAEVCGLADRKGALEVGKDADVLVVGGDPSRNLEVLRDVRAVYRAGQRVR